MTPSSLVNKATATDVLVIGEALIDIVNTPRETHEYPGGSPANVAYGLAKLGASPALWTALADDSHGDLLRAHLRGAGAVVLPWAAPLKRTSTSTVVLADDGSAQYDFNVEWDIQKFDLPWIPRLLHVGSAAAFSTPGNYAVEDALSQCHGTSLVTFDPNIRPALIPPHRESLAAFERIVSLTNVVKLSDEDADWLYPGGASSEKAAHILTLGPDLVVITQGSEGALLAGRHASIVVPSVPVTVADTIGAGDSYMAALIYSLLNTTETDYDVAALSRIGRVAAAAAAITVSRAGAQPPSRAELLAQLA